MSDVSDNMVRIVESAKVKEKLSDCKAAGMTVSDNPITGTVKVRNDNDIVLICTRKASNKWMIEYNEQYWEEIVVEEVEVTTK